MRRRLLIVLVFFAACAAFAQDAGGKNGRDLPAFRFDAGIEVPLEISRAVFTPVGITTGLDAVFPLSFIRPAYLSGKLNYTDFGMRADNSVSLVSLAIGAGYTWEVAPPLQLRFRAAGGMYTGFLNSPAVDPTTQTLYDNQGGYGGFLFGGIDAEYFLGPAFSIGLQMGYTNYLGLTQGVRVGASAILNLEGMSSNVVLRPSQLKPIFPSLAKSYKTAGAGTLEIRNDERFPIKDVRVTYQIKDVMSEPTDCGSFPVLQPGEHRLLNLVAVLGEAGMLLTSDGRHTADVVLRYTINGRPTTLSSSAVVPVFNRNAMTWDDDRKVAAFVNSKDPDVLAFAKAVSGITHDPGMSSVNLNLRLAMALFDAMGQYHISYIRDPNTPAYTEASQSDTMLDFLQYPNQTLKYKGGDCDDLSILYTSLMESIGIESAFITVPGHIYTAFSLDILPAEIKKIYGSDKDFIIIDGKAWMPLEITMVGGSFVDAWRKGGSEWDEASTKGLANLYPVEEAWKTWDCSGSPPDIGVISALDIADAGSRYKIEMNDFASLQLDAQISPLLAALDKNPRDAKALNRLGIVYGGYGRAADAEIVFKRAWEGSSYLPALVNLGNLYLLQGQTNEAVDTFDQVLGQAPRNTTAVAGLAKAYKVLGEQRRVDDCIASLKQIDQGLAESIAYLSSETQSLTRASEAVVHTAISWEWEDE